MSADPRPMPRRSGRQVFDEMIALVLQRPNTATSGAPHVRADVNTGRLLMQFVYASVPAVAIGVWSLGATIRRAGGVDGTGALSGWRRDFIVLLDPNVTAGWLDGFLVGLSFFLPLLIVSVAACALWEVAFAAGLRRPVDSGWLVTAWLYTALLPASVSPLVALIGISFGAVLGSHVFGGTGRYLVSPALLGAAFVHIAYPAFLAEDAWLAAYGTASTWTALSREGIGAVAESGATWLGVFTGREAAAFGAPSALACLLGGAYLVARGAASWRTIAGGLLGLALAGALAAGAGGDGAQIPWHWHLATGTFAFGLAFVATDPTTMPLTKAARWLHGGAIGMLTVLIRIVNPDHPEGTLSALLLASLFTPLFDHVTVAVQTRALRRRRAG